MNEFDLDIIASKLAEKLGVQPRWLKLKQAVLYSGLGKGELIRLVCEKQITGFQDNSLKTRPWILDKESLDDYRLKQAFAFNNTNDEQVALDIIESLDI